MVAQCFGRWMGCEMGVEQLGRIEICNLAKSLEEGLVGSVGVSVRSASRLQHVLRLGEVKVGINRVPVDEEPKCARILGLSAPVCSLEALLLGESVQSIFQHLSGGASSIFWRLAIFELENCDFCGHAAV